MSSIDEAKNLLRKEIKVFFKSLSQDYIKTESLKILDNLKQCDFFNQADTVFAFMPLNDEVDTASIIEYCFLKRKKVAVPKIDGNSILFYYIDALSQNNFKKHKFGMLEPDTAVSEFGKSGAVSALADISRFENNKAVMLVPGLAFDKNCSRLGRGKSFYDRFLAEFGNCFIKAGIGFDFQVKEKIPCDKHDIALDFVITQKNVYSSLIPPA